MLKFVANWLKSLLGSKSPTPPSLAPKWNGILKPEKRRRIMLHPSERVLFWRSEEQKRKNAQIGLNISFKFGFDGEQFLVKTQRPFEQKLLEESFPKLTQLMRKKVNDDRISIRPIETHFLTETSTIDDLDRDSRIERLLVNGKEFRIIRNACPIRGVILTHLPMIGYHCMPNIALNDLNTRAQCHWFVRKPIGMLGKGEQIKVDYLDEQKRTFSVQNFEFRHKGPFFVPQERDFDRIVAVIVENGEDFPAYVATSSQPVSKGPEELVTDSQMKFLKENPVENPKTIRSASYNILSDLYLDLNLTQEKLFFNYCPKQFQRVFYRTPLFLKQLEDLVNGQTSLLFLQEVDLSRNENFLRPFLKSVGFECEVAKKLKTISEGTSVVFDEKRFRMIDSQTFGLTDSVQENYTDLLSILSTSEVSKERFLSRPTIVQIVRLFDTITGHTLICANTHLHHNPADEHIKVLQAVTCVRKIMEEYQKVDGLKSVIFGGDFNSTPDGAVFNLLSQGKLPKSDLVWKCDPEIEPEDVSIEIPFDCLSGTPKYTNFTSPEDTKGFVGCLDYIWGIGAERVRICPMPEHEKVVKHGAIPSKTMPSDHLPIIVDFDLK